MTGTKTYQYTLILGESEAIVTMIREEMDNGCARLSGTIQLTTKLEYCKSTQKGQWPGFRKRAKRKQKGLNIKPSRQSVDPFIDDLIHPALSLGPRWLAHEIVCFAALTDLGFAFFRYLGGQSSWRILVAPSGKRWHFNTKPTGLPTRYPRWVPRYLAPDMYITSLYCRYCIDGAWQLTFPPDDSHPLFTCYAIAFAFASVSNCHSELCTWPQSPSYHSSCPIRAVSRLPSVCCQLYSHRDTI
jgi:hypothetical protein